MEEKIFKIMCNCKEYLKADIVAKALLKEITLNTAERKVDFIVMEIMRDREDNFPR